MSMKRMMAAGMVAGMLLTAMPALGEEAVKDVETAVPTEETAQVEAAQTEETAQAVETAQSVAATQTENSAPSDTEVQGVSVDEQKLDAAYTLALSAINAENYESAREYLNICFAYCDPQTNPTMYADLLLKRACIDVIEGKNDMALLQLDAALRVQPDLADAYLVRTQVYATLGNVDPAIENLEKYIELTGDATLYETVAQLNEAKGDAEAAQAAYDKFVKGAGGDVVEAGFQSGLYKMQSGRLEEAITDFEAYLENETYAAGAQYNIGVCRMNLGDFAKAIEAFNACEEKGGTFEGMLYNRGVCYLLSEQWEAAEADFTKSIETEPYVEDARFNVAVCQMQQGKYETAAATFTEVIDGSKQTEAGADTEVNAGAYYYRAVCNAALGNLEAALEDYSVCIEQGYELAQTYYQRAQIYAALGDTEKQNSDLQSMLRVTE